MQYSRSRKMDTTVPYICNFATLNFEFMVTLTTELTFIKAPEDDHLGRKFDEEPYLHRYVTVADRLRCATGHGTQPSLSDVARSSISSHDGLTVVPEYGLQT